MRPTSSYENHFSIQRGNLLLRVEIHKSLKIRHGFKVYGIQSLDSGEEKEKKNKESHGQ
jgi:hypothetical protein